MKKILIIMFFLPFIANAAKQAEIPTDIEIFLKTRPEYELLKKEKMQNHFKYFIDSAYIKSSGNNSVTVLVRDKKIIGYFLVISEAIETDKLIKMLRTYYPEEKFQLNSDNINPDPFSEGGIRNFYFINKSVLSSLVEKNIESLKP